MHFDDVESGNRQVIEADHVLGCDGANSVVRQAMGSRMIDLGFEQRWLVIDVETDADIRQWDGVHQVCDRRRAATYMRIGQRRYRWEFRLLDGERLSDFESMSDIHRLIAPWTRGTPREQLRLVRIADYVFRAQVADRWRRGGVFLLGDAAHLTPPFIGQGMGAGLRDANNLAWKLAGVIHRALEPTRTRQLRARAQAARAHDDHHRDRDRSRDDRRRGRRGSAAGVGVSAGTPRPGPSAPRRRKRESAPAPVVVVGATETRCDRPPSSARWLPTRSWARGSASTVSRTGTSLVTRRAPSPSLEAELARRRIATVTALDDEPLGAWLRRAGAVAAVVRPDFTVAIAGSDPQRMVAHLPGLASDVDVADRAQAQGCGRRRPVDAVPAVPATTECSILQN